MLRCMFLGADLWHLDANVSCWIQRFVPQKNSLQDFPGMCTTSRRNYFVTSGAALTPSHVLADFFEISNRQRTIYMVSTMVLLRVTF